MKIACCTLLCAASLLAFPAGILAADVSIDSSTYFGFARKDVTGAVKETLLPATQFLGLTVAGLGDGNLSLHLYGWGRTDLGDKSSSKAVSNDIASFNSDKSTGSLSYGYLQYRFNQANATVRGGRFSIHEGIANELVDGVSVRTDLPLGFGLSAFGGATVHTAKIYGENSDGKGDFLSGGRLNYRYGGLLEIGLSGVYETAAPKLVTRTAANYRRVGGDLWLTPVKAVDIIGHSSYNPETKQFADHSYLITFKPYQKLNLTGEFNQQRDQSFLYAWTMFSSSALNPNDKSTSYGGSASYEVSKNVEAAADYKHYSRERGTAERFGGDVRLNFQENSVRGGIGYHYLNAASGFAIGTNPSASYHELRCYVMHDTKGLFSAIDLLGNRFKEKIYNETNAWETTATLGYHITPTLALSGDVGYGRNPQFTEEVKGLLRVTYNFIGGKK